MVSRRLVGGGRTEVSTSAGGRGAQLLVDTRGAQLLVDTSGASWSLLRLPPTSGLALALHSPRTAFRSCNSSYLRPAWLATACLVVPFKLSAVSIQLEQTIDALFFLNQSLSSPREQKTSSKPKHCGQLLVQCNRLLLQHHLRG